ncbi:MAG: hypothetical protein E8D46_17185 [Nitrospira sp.]|nr:MAG: hypothetical protein E8D46_17185 [Nitrospira sp.]
MALYRYAVVDAYTLEELRHEYKNSDIKGRIHLFKRLQQMGYHAPYEIALLALEDVELRQWMARHAWLDYQDWDPDHPGEKIGPPERNLEHRLRNDPDPFVRACLRENPHVFGTFDFLYHWKSIFHESTHFERLALVRNPEVGHDLIEHIFDPDDTELGIGMNERSELVYAYMTNEADVRRSYERNGDVGFLLCHFSNLWALISKWPEAPKSPQYLVYRYLWADDETKTKVYQACDDPLSRRGILENSTERDTNTLKLGMKDADERNREIAFSKIDFSRLSFKSEEFFAALKGTDKVALMGLARNALLSVKRLDQVRDRLRELKNDFDPVVGQAFESIEKLKETHLHEDPYDLFGEEGGKANFLPAKIDFIGKKLLVMKPETNPYQKTAFKFEEDRSAQWDPSPLKRLMNWLGN